MRFSNVLFLLLMTLSLNIYTFEEGFVYNDDIKIVYRDYGPKDGEPILLVQGLGGQLINWPDHLLEFLLVIISDQLFLIIVIQDYHHVLILSYLKRKIDQKLSIQPILNIF